MDKIFDSHSHYNDTSFKDDYREVIKHIQESGVSNVVNVGADIFHRGLCLPSDNKMTPEEQDVIIKAVRSCFE